MIPTIHYKQQQGAVLVISLIVLLVLTVVGVVSLQSTVIEERIAGNLRDLNLAMQSSESALKESEALIEGLANTAGFGTSGGLYSLGNAPDPFNSGTWTGATSIVTTGNFGNVVAPRFFIEYVGDFSEDADIDVNIFNYGQGSGGLVSVFRVVARGTGGSGTSQVLLEEFYGRRF